MVSAVAVYVRTSCCTREMYINKNCAAIVCLKMRSKYCFIPSDNAIAHWRIVVYKTGVCGWVGGMRMIAISGPPGETGAPGATGPSGSRGPPGNAVTGSTGSSGSTGASGKYIIQYLHQHASVLSAVMSTCRPTLSSCCTCKLYFNNKIKLICLFVVHRVNYYFVSHAVERI